MSNPEFKEFAKIARLNRECFITEKIDGTNACVYVGDDGLLLAGSRSRWITSADDNFGFGRWVIEHQDELREGLGHGTHHGEWWGQGVQRKYGQDRKRFSLFNVGKWADSRPECCDVVPTLYRGLFTTSAVEMCMDRLRSEGSVAAPGFNKPEGVVVFHVAANLYFKATLDKDNEWKGASR